MDCLISTTGTFKNTRSMSKYFYYFPMLSSSSSFAKTSYWGYNSTPIQPSCHCCVELHWLRLQLDSNSAVLPLPCRTSLIKATTWLQFSRRRAAAALTPGFRKKVLPEVCGAWSDTALEFTWSQRLFFYNGILVPVRTSFGVRRRSGTTWNVST